MMELDWPDVPHFPELNLNQQNNATLIQDQRTFQSQQNLMVDQSQQALIVNQIVNPNPNEVAELVAAVVIDSAERRLAQVSELQELHHSEQVGQVVSLARAEHDAIVHGQAVGHDGQMRVMSAELEAMRESMAQQNAEYNRALLEVDARQRETTAEHGSGPNVVVTGFH